MTSRNFNQWLATFQQTNRTFSYWVDFDKVIKNTNALKIELNILNSLIGSENIADDFIALIEKYPECLKCVPLLLAVRESEIRQVEDNFNFTNQAAINIFPAKKEAYVNFMEQTGLFSIMQNRTVKNLHDYVLGVEVGLDSNARKNRGGDLMSQFVKNYFNQNNIKYTTEMASNAIENKYNLDLSPITNNGNSVKRFDFVVKKDNTIFGIEVNFYSSGGSKLNETARSYKEIAIASRNIDNFEFVWLTDGAGWQNAKNNLRETFDAMENLYNITDMRSGKVSNLLK